MEMFEIFGWRTRYYRVLNFGLFTARRITLDGTNAEIGDKSSRHELSKDVFNRNDKSELHYPLG